MSTSIRNTTKFAIAAAVASLATALLLNPSTAPAQQGGKVSYKTIDATGKMDTLAAELNQLGAEGWRVKATISPLVILER